MRREGETKKAALARLKGSKKVKEEMRDNMLLRGPQFKHKIDDYEQQIEEIEKQIEELEEEDD